MHAIALELLEPSLRPGARVLDVGSGSGYLVAVFGRLVAPAGRVIGIDHIPELTEQSLRNLEKSNNDLLAAGTIEVHAGDGYEGYLPAAPYDAIHVGAAAPVMPQKLIDQLKPGGRMVIPVGRIIQELIVVHKRMDGTVVETHHDAVRFVPLTTKDKQLENECRLA